jgi:ferritin-like metal-binding protein YciE
MADAKYRLVEWLRDAHAMEEQSATMLSSLSSRIENYPELKAKIDAHLDETRQQAKLLEERLNQISGGTSTLKDAGAKVLALGQGFSGYFVSDEVVKGALASYTFEHMEIASYRILIATAAKAGDETTRQLCQDILAQEEAMADWLGSHLDQVSRQYLDRDAAEGVTAKH